MKRILLAGLFSNPWLLGWFFLLPFHAAAQADTTRPAEAPELISPSLDLVTIQKGDNSIDCKATLKAKVKGSFVKLYGMKIRFTDSTGNELGQVVTDRSGVAVLNIKPDSAQDPGRFHVKAGFAGNKSAEAAEGEAGFQRARLLVSPVKEDSLLTLKVTLVAKAGGVETPVPETDVAVYVKRSFNPLKIGEGKTDASGELSVEIPANLAGDNKGNITLLARVDDNEQFGNLESAVSEPWGKPVSYEIRELPRALWSPHPPMWMLVTFAILMTVVWGHYIVIIYELFRLRKERPENAA